MAEGAGGGVNSPRESTCPLCLGGEVVPFVEVQARRYLDCGSCGLIHLAREQRLDPAAELAHYRLHQNDSSDTRYRAFLARLTVPLATRLPAGAEGLDFGSGPGPTVSVMLEEQGFPMVIYDPYFAPDLNALARTYDFITCTEVMEHLFEPSAVLERLAAMLRPGGYLASMTGMLRDDRSFPGWRYVRDPTHVCFYRPRTMEWIANQFTWSLEMPHPHVALFRAAD